MLLTNQRMDKLAAAAVDFEKCGMLKDSLASSHFQYLGTIAFYLNFHQTDSLSQMIAGLIPLTHANKSILKATSSMMPTTSVSLMRG